MLGFYYLLLSSSCQLTKYQALSFTYSASSLAHIPYESFIYYFPAFNLLQTETTHSKGKQKHFNLLANLMNANAVPQEEPEK